MTFASLLVVALIIFGVVATILIGALVMLVGKQQKQADAITHEQNRGSSA